MDTTSIAIIAAISATVGAVLPPLFKFIIDFFTTKRKADSDMFHQELEELRKERQSNLVHAQGITTDLQKQIFDLRQQIIDLQKTNFNYVIENAELRAKILVLTRENEELGKRLAELDSEVKALRGVPR